MANKEGNTAHLFVKKNINVIILQKGYVPSVI